ncbi:MAG: hypothetical protein EXX96DRAFT_589994 [Benjaminiella poitrasii]|nr:MAG: hypothetical protein EXX96DRAFT_589994 [Benjaminiella poitrasii]
MDDSQSLQSLSSHHHHHHSNKNYNVSNDNKHHKVDDSSAPSSDSHMDDNRQEARATTEAIPTTTWGAFTITVLVFLILLTCLILNCNRIRRKINERKSGKKRISISKRQSSRLPSFERRHKELQEADLEWNNTLPHVYCPTNEKAIANPQVAYDGSNSKRSSVSSISWTSTNTSQTPTSVMVVAQSHHYDDQDFIKIQPPSVQLRLALEKNASGPTIRPTNQDG